MSEAPMPKTTKQMSKQENIFNLYDQLSIRGAKGDAIKFIAELCHVKVGTVKNHWFGDKQIPDYVTDEILDQIIDYHDNAIFEQNKAIKNIEVIN